MSGRLVRAMIPEMSARISRFRPLTVVLRLAALLTCVTSVFVALNLRSPYLLSIREPVFKMWIAGGFLAVGFLVLGRKRFSLWAHLTATAVLVGSLIAGYSQWSHERNRRVVTKAPGERMPELGRHLVIGWLGFEETRALAGKGAIAGVFLKSSNFPPGTTLSGIRQTIDALQSVRRDAGLPPLWIATDQEGGPVSKLSPAVDLQPGLGTLLTDLDGPGLADQPERQAEIVRRVTDYADVQGCALAAAGINLNFAPVIDLRPASPPGFLDRQSRIATRAIAADPATVALAGTTYVRVLARHGVTGVLKHFPGLGRVPEDTHHFTARLDVPAEDLEARDWIPFREISRHTASGIMLGHVNLTSIDPDHPASCSAKVMRGLLQEKWGVTGLLVTDDFSMAPIFHGRGGIVRAAKDSMAAGVDLILLSYDASAAYDLLATLMESEKNP